MIASEKMVLLDRNIKLGTQESWVDPQFMIDIHQCVKCGILFGCQNQGNRVNGSPCTDPFYNGKCSLCTIYFGS